MIKSLGSYKVFALLAALAIAALALGVAIKANAEEAGGASSAPTIQSDQADYPPGGTVTLTGSGWKPGESVHIFVNDDVGKTWSRDVDVTADDSGNITDQFNLPNWFVAQYSVKATGAQSGVVTTSFTDANTVTLQGKSNPACSSGGQCDGGFQVTALAGWKELDEIPLRLKFTQGGTYSNINIDFDHFQTSSNSPGIQNLYNWGASGTTTGVTLQGQPSLNTNLSGGQWRYTLTVNVPSGASSANPAYLYFNGNLAAGAHNFTGNSLALGGNDVGGQLQITKPGANTASVPDLVVDKTGPTSAGRDQDITYTLNFQNKSTATLGGATGVQLTDVLPSGVTYVSNSCSGTCSVVGNEVTWNLGSLAKGASDSRTLQVHIPASATNGTSYTDTARIRSAEADQNMTDNDDTLTTTVSFNTAPVASSQSASLNEDASKLITLSATDADNNSLSYKVASLPANGKLYKGDSQLQADEITSVPFTLPGGGNQLTYKPDADYNGSDSFKFRANDGTADGNEATVNLTVDPVNDAPSFTAGSNQSVNEDSGAQSVSGWATNISKGPANESGQSVNFILTNDNNSLFSAQPAVSSGGTLTYTPADNQSGTATVSVKIKDDGGTLNGGVDESAIQTFTITVNPINDRPVISSVGVDGGAVDEGSPATIRVTASDPDNQATDLSYSFDCDDDNAFEKGPHAADNDACTFQDNGTYRVNVKVEDGAGGSDTSFTNVVVNNVAPRADFNAPNSVDENSPIEISLSNVTDPGSADTFEYRFKCGDDPWTAYGSSNSHSCPTTDDGQMVLKGQVRDDDGGESAEYENTVTINNVGPQAKDLTGENGQITTPEDTPKDITLEVTNPGNDQLSFSIVSGPSHGSLSGTGANQTYTPDKDYNGPDSFTFKVCDDSTPEPLCDTGDVSIEVTAVNDDPVAEDDTATVDEDNPVNIDVLANDTDPDGPAAQNLDPSTVNVVNGPQHGTATVNPNGTITYTPSADFNGTDTFTYKVCDNDAACSNPATVTVTIRSINDDPIVQVTGVDDGASYEKGQVPDPGCRVDDVEDGNQNVNPTLSNISGPLAQYGLGQQTATCSYTDQDGKTVTSQATFTIQDTTRPKVEWVKRIDILKPSNAHGLPHARATFSEDMDPSTINTLTVTLVKQSTGQQLQARVRYDIAKHKAILIPNRKLVLGAKYIATVKGGASGVTDVAGNLLDPDGDQVWVFTVRKANR